MKNCNTAVECATEIGDLKVEVMKLRDALKFYADPENRSACLISEYELITKYFRGDTPREYIVDVCATEYIKDNGDIARQALDRSSDES